MAEKPIIFYDLPSQEPLAAWSLNPWKTRLLLNYKGLNYKTAWTEYPDLQKVIGPHLPAGTKATSPAIQLPSGEFIIESKDIAQRLEALHPEKPLDLSSADTDKVQQVIGEIWTDVKADAVNKIANRLLNPPSKEYFLRTREEVFGMPLDRVEAEQGGQRCYDKVADKIKKVASWLQENKEGPFLHGKLVCYADFILIAFLHCTKRVGDDVFETLIAADPEPFRALLGASKPWLVRNDH